MAKVYIAQYHSGIYQRVIPCDSGENLYEVLTRNGILLPGAVCKGGGVCRGCQVYIAEEGMECLACRYTIDGEELHITLQGSLRNQSILLTDGVLNASVYQRQSEPQRHSEFQKQSEPQRHSEYQKQSEPQKHSELQKQSELQRHSELRKQSEPSEAESVPEFPKHSSTGARGIGEGDFPLGVAFDIGTTTIASALIELEGGKILSQVGCLNRQAEFGADVVSRIQYACDTREGSPDGLNVMHTCIRRDMEGILQYYAAEGYARERIKRITVSGNTTMIHFLRKRSVNGMAGYPFLPEQLAGERLVYQGVEIVILPGKSAFVGGDIVSGIRYLNLGTRKDYDLLIDLGTNGELWLLNQERGICTSASCGPAFANSVTKGSIHGTSLLDELAGAYRKGMVDATGLLQGEAFDKGISCGEIWITQDTVRQIQLAKAAILTGIELAAYELRLPLTDISHIYLAGGFGFYLNLDSAYCLGMFPEEFRGKVERVGNTSLSGAIQALIQPDTMLELPRVLKESKVLDLSMDKNFQEFFLHRIGFPEPIL
ncbi:MAG: ASKHA domain-containing protein [Bacteroides sp.]|nr:ASKHA domain-containing protein [Bacteroides sp.]MCM1551000.1 ASKHA domain-containing protein [Clostridium sp.]